MHLGQKPQRGKKSSTNRSLPASSAASSSTHSTAEQIKNEPKTVSEPPPEGYMPKHYSSS